LQKIQYFPIVGTCCKSHSFNVGWFEEEGLEVVILAMNAGKMLIARISQVNPNLLIERAGMSDTRYGIPYPISATEKRG